MAVFEFPQPLDRIAIDSRIRLAGTQHIVAIAEMSDGVAVRRGDGSDRHARRLHGRDVGA